MRPLFTTGDGESVCFLSAVRTAFQPIVDLNSGTLLGVEVLIRGQNHQPPAFFLRAARRAGLLVELHLTVLRQALEWAETHLSEGQLLFLNVEPQLIVNARWASELFDVSHLASRVVLEITERRYRTNSQWYVALQGYQRAGFRVAWDDVGPPPHSSIGRVKSNSADFIKIDLKQIPVAPEADRFNVLQTLVRSVSHLKATLIAEGVEQSEELRVLRQIGVSFAQGFLLGRPGHELPTLMRTIS